MAGSAPYRHWALFSCSFEQGHSAPPRGQQCGPRCRASLLLFLGDRRTLEKSQHQAGQAGKLRCS